MCRSCRTRFTPGRGKGRLSAPTLRELARCFWLLAPAAAAARDLSLQRKTAQRYYHRLRLAIAASAEAQLRKLGGAVEIDESYFGGKRHGKRGRGAGGKVPVFGLLKRGGRVRVLFPERLDRATLQGAVRKNVRAQSWVYSDRLRAYDRLSLAGFRHVRVDHARRFARGKAHINGIENFWGFAKRRLKMYHGGWKKNFRLFMREMEFRFNHRKDPKVVQSLVKMLRSGPN
jgi:transposase